jgi:NAD dependent epimerase/dehydratase
MSSFWQDKPVLVTGAGGFIGRHLTEHLVTAGARVRAFVRYNSRADSGLLKQLAPKILDQIEVVAGDLRDQHAVSQAVAGSACVFHLGALIAIPYSYQHPREVAETNLIGTLNILQACREHPVQRLVHISSSEVYGTARSVPIDESHPLQAQSPYSASKIGADKLAESFYCSYGLPVVTIRPFNTYGPWQSTRAVIPTIITQALSQDVICLGNLDARRDFTYVTDTVNGMMKGGEVAGIEGQVMNLGTGVDITIGELARIIIEQIGRPIEVVVDPNRLRPNKSEVRRLLSDYGKAQERLGWQPQVSFEQGLRQTIAWLADHLDRYRVGVYEL